MNGNFAQHVSLHPVLSRGYVQRLTAAAAATALAVLAAAGLLLTLRRLSGALVEPLTPAQMIAVGGLLAAVAAAFRWTLRAGMVSARARNVLFGLPTAIAVLWVAALWLATSAPAGVAGLLAILAAGELAGWSRLHARSAAASVVVPVTASINSPAPLEAQSEQVSQQTTRHLFEGRDTLDGWLRADFAAGQRHATAHVAICPPMRRVPECFAEPGDGPSATVKVAQVLTHGVRLEVRLDQPATADASVLVEFSIQEPDGSPQASV